MDEDEYRAIEADAAAVERLFHDLARQRLASWIELAETRLAGSGVKCFVIGGNDDDPEVLELLRDANTQSIVFCEGKEVEIDDHHTMISVGFSNRTPWKTPREVDDDDLGKMIEGLVGGAADAQHAIFNLHVPPVDSTLDTCPMLDWSTKPPTQIVKGARSSCMVPAARQCAGQSNCISRCSACTAIFMNPPAWSKSAGQRR